MPVPKADYHKIAATFGQARALTETATGVWGQKIMEMSGAEPGMRLLDIGCGPGRFAIPLARDFGLNVVGADKYPEMLVEAQRNDVCAQVWWELQDAEAGLSYPDNSFEVVFMSHLLHHIDQELRERFVGDCMRVLVPGGAIVNRYGAWEQIEDDVEHRFFPAAVDEDQPRTPSIVDIEDLLLSAGFKAISTEVIEQQTHERPEDRLEKVKMKFTSVLTLISDEAFVAGVNALSKYIEQHPDDPWLVHDAMTLTVGFKPE